MMVTQIDETSVATILSRRPARSSRPVWIGSSLIVAGVVLAFAVGPRSGNATAGSGPAEPPAVGVSTPLQRDLDTQLSFLGQYSAVEKVELRAQVGGMLTQIHFKDGDVVHRGDLLFVIDSEPYEIKLSQATAQLEAAKARYDLAAREFARAETLEAAQAEVDAAQAAVRDARFDLDRTRITAPFTGRIGSHQISVGNLVAGSRAGASPTTLLATLISLDPIYLDFDMSEADYNTFLRSHLKERGQDQVAVSSGDKSDFARNGKLDFIDNALDRSSGTIHARAVVPNNDLRLTPGGFGRVRLSMTKPAPTLLVPDASVLPDQSDHLVLTVGQDGTVSPKKVQLGDLRGGLRVIRSGLEPTDRVVIDSIPMAHPGAKVAPHAESIAYADDKAAALQIGKQ